MKKISLIILLLILVPATASAEEFLTTIETAKDVYFTKNLDQDHKIEALKIIGQKLVEQRVADLGRVKDDVNSIQRLRAEDRNFLLTEIDSSVSNLNSYKTGLNSEPNLDPLRAKVNVIPEQYRIYSLMLPKELSFLAAARVDFELERIRDLERKIEADINKIKQTGITSAKAEILLDDLKSNLSAADQKILSAKNSLRSIQKNDVQKERASIAASRQQIIEAKINILAAARTLRELAKTLKALGY